MACFLSCYTLVDLGYYIGLAKSTLTPSKRVHYLGFECDSHFQTFHLIPAKKEKFVTLVKKLLSSPSLSLLDLQKLAGKCCSMSMAVPGARLFTNELNIAISKACRSSRPPVMTTPLREEIKHWLFLETWAGHLPWRTERHFQFKLFTDASSYAWAGVLNPDAISITTSDYWPDSLLSSDIAVKET
jgi:hypothetical protein